MGKERLFEVKGTPSEMVINSLKRVAVTFGSSEKL
jgi:hypothetical protein